MKRAMLGLTAVVVLGFTAGAQQAPQTETNPVLNGLRRLEASEAKNTVAAVEVMPADKFGFRPTSQQNTFGHLVSHMVEMNYRFCSMISGAETPKVTPTKETDPKDTLVPALKASFDFCTQTLANVEDSKLGEQVPFFGGRMTSRGAIVVILAQDYGDHYSTAAMYLRLNGLLPPTAQAPQGPPPAKQ
jgi:uncharacterized damage-inducible protein DinB